MGKKSEIQGTAPVNDPVNVILEIVRANTDYSYKQIAGLIRKSEATLKRAIAKLKSENRIKRKIFGDNF